MSLVLLIPVRGIAHEFTFAAFGQNEGLAHTQILSISEDANGNLWLGTTAQAIYRFDGKRFYQHKITLPDYDGGISMYNILADPENRIWLLTSQGLLQFDGRISRRIPSQGNAIIDVSSRIFLDQYRRVWLLDAIGNVYEAKQDGLLKRSDINAAVGDRIVGYYLDKENVNFHTAFGATISVNASGAPQKQILPWWVPSTVMGVYPADESVVITSPGRLYEFKGDSSKQLKLPTSFSKHVITQVVYDRNNHTWFLAANKVFVIENEKLHLVSGTANFPANYSNVLFCDSNGDVWISVDGLGLLKYKKQAWSKVAATGSSDITCMAELPGTSTVIFGTYADGIIGFDKPVLIGRPITSICPIDSRTALAGTLETGLFRIFDNIPTHMSLTNNSVEYVHGVGVKGDSILVGTQSAFFIIEGSVKSKYQKKVKDHFVPVANPVSASKEIYLSSMSGGLMKLAGDSIATIGPEFLNESTIYLIRRQKWGGYVVAGEFSKILFLDDQFVIKYSIDISAFASNVLIAEFIDQSTAIIGSNDGLFKVVLDGDHVRTVKKYGKGDGYGGEELYVGSSVTKANGEILIGTTDGAYAYDMENDETTFTPTNVYLTAFEWINPGKPEPSENLHGYFRLPKDLNLTHVQNSVSVSYDYSNLDNFTDILFHHWLEGLEDDWSHANKSQQVTYSNLPPGSYTFHVQALAGKVPVGNICSYAFTIAPAFWQTPWFVSLSTATVVLIVFLVTRQVSNYRIRQHKLKTAIRAEESVRIRKQMSMDFHDEMGNRLAGMVAQSSMHKMRHKNTELESIFDYFEKNAYAIFHGTKDFIWTIDVRSANLKEVILYLRDFGCQLFERNEITFHVEDDILLDVFDIPLADGENRQIILIFKEAMTNALRHAHCKNVFFTVKQEAGKVEMIFADDGTWAERAGAWNGIKNMQNRAQKMGAQLFIGYRNERTTISLSFNCNNTDANG